VSSESVSSETVISAPTAVSHQTDSPITDSLNSGTPTTGTEASTFPWTVLLVLAPLPLILLALLRKR
jgi:hypothetical protein